MDKRIINVLREIRDQYGDMIFYNHQKTKNLMNDLAPGMHKERIHINQFLELNGYFQLKYAGHSFPVIRTRLIKNYSGTYAVNEQVAEWTVDIFSDLLGYSDFKDLDKMLYRDEFFKPAAAVLKEEKSPSVELPGVVHDNIKEVKPKAKAKINTEAKAEANAETQPNAASQSKKAASAKRFDISINDLKKRISADMHSVAILPNGRVIAIGPNDEGQCNVEDWKNIIVVSAGPFFTVGLQENGRVVACGRNEYGQCNVKAWRNIVAVSAGARHTVGLKADGTVVATGQNRYGECNVVSWRNITHISAGYLCTFGIKKDHKVLVKGSIKENSPSIGRLSNIQDIANPYPYRAVALKRSGVLVPISQDNASQKSPLQKSLEKWKNVKQISAGPDYFAGLFKDGTVRVLAYYWISTGIEFNADSWTDIAAIAAGRFHLLGVKKDGTMVATMMHPSRDMDKGQCMVRSWSLL